MNKIEQLEEQVKELAKRLKVSVLKLEDKYQRKFERQARFVGNSIYTIAGLYSTDPRELKLMFTLQCEGVKVNDKDDPTEGDDE